MHTKSLVEICQGIIGKHLDGKDIPMIAIAQPATGSLGFTVLQLHMYFRPNFAKTLFLSE